MEAAGIEPECNFDPSAATISTSGKCDTCGAARALHSCGTYCPFLSSLDADLRSVIEAWDWLPAAIQKAIAAIIETNR